MAQFEDENSFWLYLSRFTGLTKNICFHQIKIFLRICTISNLWKNNFLSNCKFLFEMSFIDPKENFCQFQQKCFKTPEKLSLTVCGSFCGGKPFLVIFILFHCLTKNGCFHQIKNFLRTCPFSKLLIKINFWVILSFFLRCHFLTQKRSVSQFPRKCFKTPEKLSLAVVCGSFWGGKQFLVILVLFHWFDQKKLFPSNKIFLRIYSFSKLLRKKNS